MGMDTILPDSEPDITFEMPEDIYGEPQGDRVPGGDLEVAEDPATAAAREAQQALRVSQELRRPIDRAVKTATISAWTLAVFGVFSLPGVFSSFAGFVIAVGLGVCAYFEFRGRNALRDMKPEGATALARNQLVLGGVIVVYALANIVATETGTTPYAQAVEDTPELGDLLGPGGTYTGLVTNMMLAYYVVVGLAGVISQTLMFLYHQRRRPLVEAFVAETPAWILEPAPAARKAG